MLFTNPHDLTQAAHAAEDMLTSLLNTRGSMEIHATGSSLPGVDLQGNAHKAAQATWYEREAYTERITQHVEALKGASRLFSESDEHYADLFNKASNRTTEKGSHYLGGER